MFISGLRALWGWNGHRGEWAGGNRYFRMIANRYTDRSGQKEGGGAQRTGTETLSWWPRRPSKIWVNPKHFSLP